MFLNVACAQDSDFEVLVDDYSGVTIFSDLYLDEKNIYLEQSFTGKNGDFTTYVLDIRNKSLIDFRSEKERVEFLSDKIGSSDLSFDYLDEKGYFINLGSAEIKKQGSHNCYFPVPFIQITESASQSKKFVFTFEENVSWRYDEDCYESKGEHSVERAFSILSPKDFWLLDNDKLLVTFSQKPVFAIIDISNYEVEYLSHSDINVNNEEHYYEW